MTIRDIKFLSKIIQNKIDLGIATRSFYFEEFEKKTKHSNFIFSVELILFMNFLILIKKIK